MSSRFDLPAGPLAGSCDALRFGQAGPSVPLPSLPCCAPGGDKNQLAKIQKFTANELSQSLPALPQNLKIMVTATEKTSVKLAWVLVPLQELENGLA